MNKQLLKKKKTTLFFFIALLSLSFQTSLFSQSCPQVDERVYATQQTWSTPALGMISNEEFAVDGDPATHSTLTSVIDLAGLGSVTQNLSWGGSPIASGTPVSIKLGPEVSLLGAISVLSVEASNNGIVVSDSESVQLSLLNLVSGENAYEFTFVPTASGLPVEYDEINITVGGLLSVAVSINIYEAYYHQENTTITNCGSGDVLDLFYGVEDLGIGALTATVGVQDPFLAIDTDDNTFATMHNSVGVLARAQFSVVFKSPSKQGDELNILLSSPGNLLSVTALEGFTIQRYDGANAVGSEIDLSNGIVDIDLLDAGDYALVNIHFEDNIDYNRVELLLGGLAGVLSAVQIHEIYRTSQVDLLNAFGYEINLAPGQLIQLASIDTCTTYQVFDENGNPLSTSDGFSFNLPPTVVEGETYSFYVQGVRYGCPFGQPKEITVNVTANPSVPTGECPDINQRVYGTSQTWSSILFGSVSNEDNAIDGDPTTYSTIQNTVNLLGLGNTSQDISWGGNPIAAGTPVSVKLGPDIGLLGLISGVTLTARNNGSDVGNPELIDFDLLNLINGENAYEYTFVPNVTGIAQEYDEVRITVGGLLGLLTSVNVYEAYYHESVDLLADCGDDEVIDVLYGVDDLGIGALTATVGVANPYLSVDNEVSTFATMFNGASVLARAQLTTIFNTPSKEGDIIEITLSDPGTILNVGLLDGFVIQRYYGATPVGDPIDFSGSVLSLELLDGGGDLAKVIADTDDNIIYDRIEISLGGVANVLDGLRIHEIDRVPPLVVEGEEEYIISLCALDTITIDPVDDCSTYEIFDEDGNPLATTDSFTFDLPTSLVEGQTYNFFVQTNRYGCPFGVQRLLEVTVLPSSTSADLEDIQVNGTDGVDPVCVTPTDEVILTTALTSGSTIPNPTFVWYDENGDLVEENTTGILNLGIIAPGTYTYSVGVSGDDYCESPVAQRKEITFTVQPYATGDDIDVDDDQICFDEDAVLTPASTTIVNPVFSWYLDNTYDNSITDGDVINGVTYSIDANGVLTVSGLEAGDIETYFVSVSNDDTCENQAGDFASATVTVYDVPTPTTNNTDQTFCAVDEPTVEDLQVNESDVVWFDAPTGGNQLDPTDALMDDTSYYGVLISTEGCESSVRLEVAVTINDTPTPTTTNTTQTFCLVDEPTVADLDATGENIVWYDAPTDGTAYNTTDALMDNTLYYAAATDATGCESSVRLEVLVLINDTPTPTTTDPMQTFCAVDEPKIADLIATGENIVWYDAPTDGNAYDSTDALMDNTLYYAAATNATGCESSTRLEVLVLINDTPTPTTTNTTQGFCEVDGPTIADLDATGENIVWYDAPSDGNAYDPTDPLVDGETYYAAATNSTGCESSERLEVMVIVGDTPTPTTDDTTQDFCVVDNPIVADLQADGPNIIWYDAPTGGNPYDPSDALISGNIYYASATDSSSCESSERLAVTVTVSDTPTPTTNNSTQSFCLVDNPTVADIEVSGQNLVWYDAPTGGTAYDPTDALINGNTYYATATNATGCESSVRLEVMVIVGDSPTPTTSDPEQEFCAVDNPTISDLQATGQNIVWYDAPAGGNAYDPNDPLVNGMTYYAASTATSGCESSERLEVSVIINDTPTPTTDNQTQEFCEEDDPIVADLQASGNNIVWYDAPTGGNPYASNDPLEDGQTYYAAATNNTGCESSQRLAVLVQFNQASNPTIISSGNGPICLEAITTYTTEEGQSNYIWDVTGGVVMNGGGSNDNFVSVEWTSLENTSLSVSYEPMQDCLTGELATFNEMVEVCADLTIDKVADIMNPMIGDAVTFTITVANNGPNDFVDLQIEEDLPSGFQLINYDTTIGTYNPVTDLWIIDVLPASEMAALTIVAEVLPTGNYTNIATIVATTPEENDDNNSAEVTLEPQCLTVYNEFTPNEDGINDTFKITCIENYPNNSLMIFNRYGSLIYEANGYQNEWNGISNKGGSMASRNDGRLPEGTYYYVLKIDDNSEARTGWVYLMR